MKLVVDTSNNFLILALVDKSIIIDFFKKELKRELTEKFHTLLNEFLFKNKIQLDNIREIMVVNGPGSFTGIKIGLNFANTIKVLNNDIKLYQIDSLSFLQKNKDDKTSIDAKGGFAYIKKNKKITLVNQKKNEFTSYKNIDKDNLIFNLNKFKIVKKVRPNYVKRGY